MAEARSVWRVPPSALGTALAALGFAAALGPSLLPRGTVTQAAGCALCAVTLYALGAVVAAVGRLVRVRPGRRWRTAAWVVAVLLWAGALALVPSRLQWQDDQAAMLGMAAPAMSALPVVGTTAGLLLVLLGVGRALRALARRLDRGLRWYVPYRPVSTVLGGVGAGAALAVVLGLAFQAVSAYYTTVNASTTGQSPPTSSLRSGGPGSSQSWESLGATGRQFTAGGLQPLQLGALPRPGGAQPASVQEPIRAYVGLASAGDARQRAAEAVEELRRTGAFERSTLLVATPAGNGFVDPDALTAVEAVTGGDVASVAIQYSALPSWLSFLVDQPAAEDAGTALLDAVLAQWRDLPTGSRPRIVVFGESLGAFGGQAAYGSAATPEQVVTETAAVTWVGPPGGSELWPWWSTALRTGGPAWQPQIDGGGTARVALGPADLAPDQPGWGDRRVALVVHPQDPVVYWSPALALTRPDWIATPGPGVDPRLTWWPLLTFWSVMLDLGGAGAAPPGVGHNYTLETARAVVAALHPPGWTTADVDRLQEVVAATRPAD